MKKAHFIGVFLFVLSLIMGKDGHAQNCIILKDSITQGINSTEFNIYHYNSGILNRIDHYESGSSTINRVDSVLYDSQNRQHIVRSYNPALTSVVKTVTLTYDSQSRVSRLHIAENDGLTTSTIAFDATYNGNNELTDIKADAASISGSPSIFAINFESMVWANGNVITMEVVGNFGLGVDTLELAGNSDNKKNFSKLLPLVDPIGLIQHNSANNLKQLLFVEDEFLGPAGTLAIDYIYTYRSDDNVATRKGNDGILLSFANELRTVAFTYQCVFVGLDENSTSRIEVFPNPAYDKINIKSTLGVDKLELYNLNGSLVKEQVYDSEKEVTFDLASVPKGVYGLKLSSIRGEEVLRLVVEF